MGINVYQSGAWKTVSDVKVYQSNQWVGVNSGFVRQDNAWKPIFSAVAPLITPSPQTIGGTLTLYRGSDLSGTYDYVLKRADNSGMTTNVTTVKSGTLTGSTTTTTHVTSSASSSNPDVNEYFQLEVTYLATVYKSNVVRVVRNAPVFTTTLMNQSPGFYTNSSSSTALTNITKGTSFVGRFEWDNDDRYNAGSYSYSISTDTDGVLSGGSGSGTISSGRTLTTTAVSVPSGSSATSVTISVTLSNTGGDTTANKTLAVTTPPTLVTNPTFTGNGLVGSNFSITGGSWTNATTVTRYIEATSSTFNDPTQTGYSPAVSKYNSTADGSYAVTFSDAYSPAYYMRGVVIATGPGGTTVWKSNSSNTAITGSVKTYYLPTTTTPTVSSATSTGFTVSWTAGSNPAGGSVSSTVQIWNSSQTAIVQSISAVSPYTWTGGSASTTYYAKIVVTANDANSNTGASSDTTTSAFSSAITTNAASVAPYNISSPSITSSGTGVAGGTTVSVVSDGTWGGTPTPTTSRVWQSTKPIGGSTYTTVSGAGTGTSWTPDWTHGGYSVRELVTATNGVSPNATAASNSIALSVAVPSSLAPGSFQYHSTAYPTGTGQYWSWTAPTITNGSLVQYWIQVSTTSDTSGLVTTYSGLTTNTYWSITTTALRWARVCVVAAAANGVNYTGYYLGTNTNGIETTGIQWSNWQ